MKSIAGAAILATLLVACGRESADAETPQDRDDTASAASNAGPQFTRQDVPGAIEGREVAEVALEQMRPSFTKETVVRLNAIVRRSVDVANEYTRNIKQIRMAAAAAAADRDDDAARARAEAGLADLREWREAAAKTQGDMHAAADEVRASGETYSAEILSGMVKYTDDVEMALADEIDAISAQLANQ